MQVIAQECEKAHTYRHKLTIETPLTAMHKSLFILSDYPIKALTLARMIKEILPEYDITHQSDLSLPCERLPDLVVVDLNLTQNEEPHAKEYLLGSLKSAKVVFLEEDHSNIEIRCDDGNMIASMGKRADNSVLKDLIKLMARFHEGENPEIPESLQAAEFVQGLRCA